MSDQNLGPPIRALSDPGAMARTNAARAVFAAGAELIRSLLRDWMDDPELAACVAFAGPPQVTVGIAVEPEQFERIRAANGMPPLADVPPDQDAKEFELDFAGGVHLDVLTSRDPSGSGAIARYLKKLGEGIQQVEVNVNDVGRATEILRVRSGIEPIYPATRAGANGTRVNFFLVPAAGGGKLLVELVQD
jgi:hypothetical protein